MSRFWADVYVEMHGWTCSLHEWAPASDQALTKNAKCLWSGQLQPCSHKMGVKPTVG